MRPSGGESLRAIQSGLAEVLGPELQTPFAKDATQTLQMLVESLAAEWDTAAEDLRRDSAALERLLMKAGDTIRDLPDAPPEVRDLLFGIGQALGAPSGETIAVSALMARHTELSGALESLLCTIEDMAPDEGHPLSAVRREMYVHLREVAVRGWSFWDVASFRERIARARGGSG